MSQLKLFIPLIIFIFLGAFLFVANNRLKDNDPNELPSALVGKPFPSFELIKLGTNDQVSKKDILGERFLLNVWATWCPTCVYEHPYLVELSKQGVKIVGLNYKDEDPKALDWLKKLGNPYVFNIVDKSGRLGLDLGVYGAPETFVVDKAGTIHYRFAGELNERVWKEKIEPVYSSLVQ